MRKRKLKIKKKVGKIFFAIILAFFLYKLASPYLNTFKSIEKVKVDTNQTNLKEDLEYDDVSSLKYIATTLENRLEELKKQDSRVNKILENQEEYPPDLIDMLSRNKNMLDFVLDFSSKKGIILENKVKEAKKGIIPLLLQWDKRWGYGNYGDTYLAINGCAPTSLSMVITGLTGKDNITPYAVSKYAEENGYYIEGIGTSWSLMTEGSRHFGVIGEEFALSKNAIYHALESGKYIICSVRKGDFTTTGHFIVLAGIQNGKLKINDPNSIERSSILWDYERIESQIKNLWVFSLT